MSDQRGIDEVTIYYIMCQLWIGCWLLAVGCWLLAVGYRNHRSYQSDRTSNL